MVTLHDDPISGNGYKVRLLLGFLNTPYSYVTYDIIKGATRTDAFLTRVNPNGRIPVLQLDDGRILPESNAILCFLARGTAWLPTDPWHNAQVMSWLFWEQYSHEPNVATPRFWAHLPSLDDIQRAALPAKMTAGREALSLMDAQLIHTDWLVADTPTIADIALYAYTHVAEEGGFSLDDFGGIRRWLARFANIPGYTPMSDFPAD